MREDLNKDTEDDGEMKAFLLPLGLLALAKEEEQGSTT